MSFPDAADGWVVGTGDEYGDGSIILHTSDGGATWGPQQSNLGGGLDGVDFVDAHTGWAITSDNTGWNAGANVTMEHTTDGGATWIPQFVAGNTALSAVSFVDGATGWAAGGWYASLSAFPQAAVFGSTDGGFTWTQEKLPKGSPAITGLQFVSKTDGWAVGTSYVGDWYDYTADQGWVLHTTDGGATWTRVAGLADSQATTVHFSDPADGWVGGLNGVYATTDGGTTWQRVAAGEGVEAIAATDPQHVWAFGDGFLAATIDAGAGVDSAAPVTLDTHADSAWHNKPLTIGLTANDIGSAGLAFTQSSLDGGPWKTGPTISVPAYGDHHFDGVHTIVYRSADNAGNQEQTESLTVGVDTLGPACSVPRKSVVDTGQRGALYFMATDMTSGVKRATITIVGAHGRVLKRFVQGTADWGMSPAAPYFWMRFKCTLKPGTYRVEVHATDWAGNRQVTVGRGTLRVVRSGAPGLHGAVLAGRPGPEFQHATEPRPASRLAAAPARQPGDRACARPSRRLEGAALGRDRRTPVAGARARRATRHRRRRRTFGAPPSPDRSAAADVRSITLKVAAVA